MYTYGTKINYKKKKLPQVDYKKAKQMVDKFLVDKYKG